MTPIKLIGWAAIAIAVIGAFVEIPYAGLLLLLLGLAGGVSVAIEDSVRVMVTALVLAALSTEWMNVPELGVYLTSIFSAAGTFVAGAALTLISRNMWNRFKP